MVLDWAKNWVTEKVYGAARTGIQAGGNLAGNAVGGVGTFIQKTGRGVGQSTSDAIGGVGSYINNYGQSIIDSTAASGEKKHAVRPAPARKGDSMGVQSSTQAARPVATTSAPKRTKPSVTMGPHITTATRTSTASGRTKAVSKPTRALAGNQPAGNTSRSSTLRPIKNVPAKKPPTTQPRSTSAGGKSLPKISASASDRTSDGKVKLSMASRPQSLGSSYARKPVNRAATHGNGGKSTPLPKIAAGKNDRTTDGKTRVSRESRPRHAVGAR